MKRRSLAAALAIFAALHAVPAYADSGDMMSMLESMKKQMTQMQETIERQNLRIQQLESRTVLETPQSNAELQPSSASQISEADWQKGIKDNIGEAVPWLKGLKQSGDLRLRQEYFDYYDKDNADGSTAADRSRNRTRLRLRWGLEKDFADDWKAGFRLATGSSTDQVSENQTLGNRGYFTYKDIFIDKAYAEYSPNGLKEYGPIRGVTIGAGKVENPFTRYSTTIVWDGDVTPEGLYEKVKFSLASSEENKVNAYVNLGQFIVNENLGAELDAQLYAYQGALEWSTYNFDADHPFTFTFATSFYDYPNYSQTVLAATNTAATSYLRTNTTAMDNPQVLDFYPEVQFTLNNLPVTLWGNYVENVGRFDETRLALNPAANDDTAYGFGIKLNKVKKRNDWEAFYGYYEIGTNAVVAAFNDSDFGGPGQLGHTNRVGHKFGWAFGLTDSLTFNWTNFLVDTLSPTSFVANSQNESVWRTQADLVFKF